jgi:hypothetical protein
MRGGEVEINRREAELVRVNKEAEPAEQARLSHLRGHEIKDLRGKIPAFLL